MISHPIFPRLRRSLLRAGGCLLLFGASHGSLAASDTVVTFNEIQYHPLAGSAEWIELHNQFSIRIELSGWRLSGGIDFVFPSGTILEPGGFLVVAGEGESGRPAGALGPFTGRLDNAGETIRLRDLNDRVMDELDYGDTAPWPVVPDGSGATLSKRGPDLPTHRPDSWTWSSAAGGTPGAANFSGVPAPGPLGDVVLAEVSGTDEGPEAFGLELWNRGGSPVELEGLRLLLLGGQPAEWISGSRILAPGARLWAGKPWEGYEPDRGDRVALADAGGNFLDGVNLQRRGRSRSNGGGDEWFVHDNPTPGEENAITLEENVVIHEILYHFPPQYEDPAAGIDFAKNPEEWIELFNRGETPVDLTGWSLGGGVDFAFAPGTVLDPGGYLVVSNDVAALQGKYPEITVMGPLDGNLSNRSDLVLLLDGRGNQVDRVEYFDNGRWPRWADGGGSSLELRDPFADNALPEAWAASDESGKGEWVDIEYEGQAREPVRSNNPSQFHEFLMGLLSAGEVLVDDVSVVENPAGGGIEFIQNGDFSRVDIFTGALSKWRILGTHASSRVEDDPDVAGNKVLRLTATGRLEHSYNIASTTYANSERLDDSASYRISLRARWLRGSPQLNTRLYFNRLAQTHVLPIPDRLGTPGSANSVQEANIGPVFTEMRARPIVPEPNEAVRVEIAAGDPQGVDAAEIWFRPEGGVWSTLPMTPSEGEGRFSGEIPGQPNGSLVQFFVRARDGIGAAADYPAEGAASRALYRVGDQRAGQRDVKVVRLLMLDEEHRFMRRAEHAVSNGRIGGTFVAGDDEVYYDVGIRLRSSPYGRQGNRAGYNVHFGRM
ncbi:MAG TPA: lamin tail domain-containing protein, partial [Verrucomicrobiales bacterium]|nr:lamin tail domain-containing protein [Verrucomicrobiales bacterium]